MDDKVAYETHIEIFNNNFSEVESVLSYFKNLCLDVLKTDKSQVIVSRNQIKKLDDNLDILVASIEKMYHGTIRDKKTNLYNYAFFKQFLKLEKNKINRYKNEELILLLIDIDHFKKVNDTYGHIVGDEVLKEISQLFKKSIRDSDLVARYGGEEFAILLTNADIKMVNLIIDRIKDNILHNELLKKYNVRVSGGVTSYKIEETIKDFIHRADCALYEAKQKGRDRFIFNL